MTDRLRRYRVYSKTHDGNPLLVESFDLPQQAQLLADRINTMFLDLRKEYKKMVPPKVYVLDAGTGEEVKQCSGR